MKKAIITGASSGVGEQLAKLLLSKKISVVNLSRTKPKANVSHIETDLGNNESIQNAIKEIKSNHSDFDVLINCSGIYQSNEIEDVPFETVDEVMAVNTSGMIKLTSRLLGLIKKNKGDIVNICSYSGLNPRYPKESAYSASKFGARGFTEYLQAHLRKESVRVIGLYPGGINTNLFKNSGENIDTKEFMDPKDIAKTIIFALELPKNMELSQITIMRSG